MIQVNYSIEDCISKKGRQLHFYTLKIGRGFVQELGLIGDELSLDVRIAEINRPLKDGFAEKGALAHFHGIEVCLVFFTFKLCLMRVELSLDVRTAEIHRPLEDAVRAKQIYSHSNPVKISSLLKG